MINKPFEGEGIMTVENENRMENIEKELYNTFLSFFEFAFELIEKVNETNNYLKFAVVNMQISLELFLKYYFVKKGKLNDIVRRMNEEKIIYKDFLDVLNLFFSVNRWTYGNKKELTKILEARNNIVHNGLQAGWNEELAIYLIGCIFFIQGTMYSNFNEGVISQRYGRYIPTISHNVIWISGAEKFAKRLLKDKDIKPQKCPECGAHSLVPNDIFCFSDTSLDNLQCLCCYQYIDIEFSAELIDCHVCLGSSYLVEKLNPQKDAEYCGYCLSCSTNENVRKCSFCDRFYHPKEVEFIKDNKYYCSKECLRTHET